MDTTVIAMIWFSATVSDEIYPATYCQGFIVEDFAHPVNFGLWPSQFPMLPSLLLGPSDSFLAACEREQGGAREMRGADGEKILCQCEGTERNRPDLHASEEWCCRC